MAPGSVVVELDDELLQAARPRPEAATTTSDQVRRRVMSKGSFRFGSGGRGTPCRTVAGATRGQTVAAPEYRPDVRSSGPGPVDTPPCHHGPMLLDRLPRVTDQLRSSVAELDPERLSGPDAARLLDAFAEVERLAAAGRLLAARRVESSNVWRRAGHRSAAAHVAEATGTGSGRPSPPSRRPASLGPCRPPTRPCARVACPRPRSTRSPGRPSSSPKPNSRWWTRPGSSR